MRKLALIVFLFLCFAVPITAQDDTPDLTTLAAYLPADAPVYAAFRTDAEMIATLERLLATLKQSFPDMMPPDVTVQEALDNIANNIDSGGDFESVFGTWLGDSIALGALTTDVFTGVNFRTRQPVMLFEVADRAAAGKFLENLSFSLSKNEDGAFTRYTTGNDTYLLGDDVMVVSSHADYLEKVVSGDFANLANNPDFTETLALLPADGYGGVVYADLSAIYTTVYAGRTIPELEQQFMTAFAQFAGQQAYGFGLLNERDLVIDFASRMGDASALEAIGLSGLVSGYFQTAQALDPTFAAHLPGDAQFVFQGSGLGQQVIFGFEAISAVGEIAKAQMRAEMERRPMAQTGAVMEVLDQYDFGGLSKGSAILMFAGLTGLHLEDDVLSWMTGDFAGIINLISVDDPLRLSLDLAFVTAATDADAAANVVSAMTQAAILYDIATATETVGEGEALVLPSLLRGLMAQGIRVDAAKLNAIPELDLLIGSNGDVFAIGTRPGVESALNPSRGTLAENSAYAHIIDNLLLPGANQLYFVNTQAIRDAINRTPFADTRDARQWVRGLGMFESASFNAAVSAPNVVVGRFALTLAGE